MSLKTPGGLPPAVKAMLLESLAKQFPDMDVELHEVGVEEATDTDDATAARTCDGMGNHRAHLIELVFDNLEDFDNVDQVINAADKLFQYITTGKVPA